MKENESPQTHQQEEQSQSEIELKVLEALKMRVEELCGKTIVSLKKISDVEEEDTLGEHLIKVEIKFENGDEIIYRRSTPFEEGI